MDNDIHLDEQSVDEQRPTFDTSRKSNSISDQSQTKLVVDEDDDSTTKQRTPGLGMFFFSF